MANGKKVCIVHYTPIGSKMYDLFISRNIANGSYSYANHYGDYWASQCEFVKKFIREHPDYVYVGSSDDFLKKPKIPYGFKRIVI